MAYRKKTWADGEVIDAEKLNNIENGISEAHKAAEDITPEKIGAAPNGYGLGGYPDLITTREELDAFHVCGWKYVDIYPYVIVVDGTTPIYNGVVRCDADGGYGADGEWYYCSQTLYSNGSIFVRYGYDYENYWSEWQLMNPEMWAGEEYCTSEMFNAYPVYSKIIDCGALTKTSKNVEHGIDLKNMTILRVAGAISFRYVQMIPYKNIENYADITVAENEIQISSKGTLQYDNNTLFVQIWYVKVRF